MTEPALAWVIIGPNGSGKSTYYEHRLRPLLKLPFINADAIARARWPEAVQARSYDAAKLAEEIRERCLAERRGFVFETVFSHPSKLDFLLRLKAAGFHLRVTFVNVDSPDLNVARVADRVRRGGHPVPPEKVRSRALRMVELACKAARLADVAYIVDNTSTQTPLRDVLRLERGDIAWRSEPLPAWVRRAFTADLKRG